MNLFRRLRNNVHNVHRALVAIELKPVSLGSCVSCYDTNYYKHYTDTVSTDMYTITKHILYTTQTFYYPPPPPRSSAVHTYAYTVIKINIKSVSLKCTCYTVIKQGKDRKYRERKCFPCVDGFGNYLNFILYFRELMWKKWLIYNRVYWITYIQPDTHELFSNSVLFSILQYNFCRIYLIHSNVSRIAYIV